MRDDIKQSEKVVECKECGMPFLLRKDDIKFYLNRGWNHPEICADCRSAKKKSRDLEESCRQNAKWEVQKKDELNKFESMLDSWNVISLQDIRLKKKALYVIGNGFDLMHGVQSSYYRFRDFLGKNGSLRSALDTILDVDDIWADFEEALAHFNMDMMGNEFIVDGWLDSFGAYEEDALAADYFLAAEEAAGMMLTISYELPIFFRRWVESLSIRTDERPLKNILHDGKVLCFNYTEFVEECYGVPRANVCYIHGCRRKEKYHKKEDLILGHKRGASEYSFEICDSGHIRKKTEYAQYLLDSAVDNVFRIVADADESLTKDSREIIRKHKDFFDDISGTEEIFVFGHSYSEVDWDYFSQIYYGNTAKEDIQWYFGCHGIRDLQNLSAMLNEFGIRRERVHVFRTDTIHVKIFPLPEKKLVLPKTKILCESADGLWNAYVRDKVLGFKDNVSGRCNKELQFSGYISRGLFIQEEQCFLAVMHGVEPGLFLFRLIDEEWRYIAELETVQNQGIVNRRLRKVLYLEHELIFVYNNRIRKYSLQTGALTYNRQVLNAPEKMTSGVCVSDSFIRY